MYKIIGESTNEFNLRKDFYNKLLDKKISTNESHKLSVIWSNIKFRKCRYPSDIYHLVKIHDKSI